MDRQADLRVMHQTLISHRASLQLLDAVVDEAERLGIRINAAVYDSSGQLAGFVRMPGSFLISIEMACKKARGAAGLGIEPAVVESVLAHEHPRVREGLLFHPDLTLVRGGLPIRINGELVGAVGVSGGSEAQDEQCALAGLSAIGADGSEKASIHLIDRTSVTG